MKRLTEKTYSGFNIKNPELETDYTNEEIFNVLQKLGLLENIEEELGIELVVLFKALKNGIYVKTYGCGNSNFNKLIITKKKCPTLKLDYKTHTKLRFEQKFGQHFETYELKDYGKTWALTREELL